MKETQVKEERDEKSGNGHADGMQMLAKKETRHYTAPLPEAMPPPVNPFPRGVMAGLAGGALAGGLVGLIFGLLLVRNLLVIPGWEALYSMAPFTFVVFWASMGLALGVLVIGVGTLLGSPAEDKPEREPED